MPDLSQDIQESTPATSDPVASQSQADEKTNVSEVTSQNDADATNSDDVAEVDKGGKISSVLYVSSHYVEGPPVKTVSEDERFTKYFKMLKMGVPMQAVKNKMKAEGLDDSVLDNPDAPLDSSNSPNNDDNSSGDESDSWD